MGPKFSWMNVDNMFVRVGASPRPVACLVRQQHVFRWFRPCTTASSTTVTLCHDGALTRWGAWCFATSDNNSYVRFHLEVWHVLLVQEQCEKRGGIAWKEAGNSVKWKLARSFGPLLCFHLVCRLLAFGRSGDLLCFHPFCFGR